MFVPMNCPTCRKEVMAEAKTDRWNAVCPGCGGRLATPAGFAPGTVLDTFTIGSRLGTSSAEETYLGTQPVLGRPVMIKILPPDMVGDAESFGRFQRQIKLVAALQHPGILGAIAAGQDAGMHYLVTEFKPGRALKEHLAAKGGRLPEPEALALLADVADALRYAWEEQGMLHRNVKPGAVWVTDEGRAVLMDLGLAKSCREPATADVTLAGYTVGTPEYMSPEQARGDATIDFRADVYSLGIVLYQCLVGAVPFAGKSAMDVLNRQLDETPVPARQRNPQVSARCSALLERMLAKAPETRCQSWREIVEEMRALAVAKPAAAGQRSPAQAARPPGTPRPVSPAALSAAARSPQAAKAEAAFKLKLWLLYTVPPAVLVLTIVVMVQIMNRARRQQAPTRAPAVATQAVPAPTDVSAPTDTAPAPRAEAPQPAVDARRDEEMLAYARQYYREHPTDYAGAVARLRTVREQLAGTKYAIMAEEAMAGVEADRTRAAASAMDELRGRAGALADAGDFAGAIALCEADAGPLAADTAAPRRMLAEELRRRQAAAAATAAEQADALAQQLEQAGAGAARACLGGKPADMTAAAKPLQALAGQAAARETAQAWLALLTAAGAMDAQLARSFAPAAATGKPIQVRFEKDGAAEIEVKAVEGLAVQADRLVREADGTLKGRMEMRFTANDLHLSEKLARLRQSQAPERELLCGLAAWRAGNRKLAADSFRAVDTPVAKTLLAQCGE
jgi:serine/threonine-protein kinase